MKILVETRVLLVLAALVIAPGCDAVGRDPGAASSAATAPVTTRASTNLVPPSGFMAAVVESGKDTRACPKDAIPYTAPLDFPSRYEGSDKARDDVNPKAEKEYKRLIAPITAMEKGLSGQVDDYMRSGSPEALACAFDLLRQWSAANALMGEALNHTGKSMRKWAMGSIASSYLRLKFSATQPLARDPELARRVEAWLGRIADRVVEEWRDAPLEKTNNHEYWAAWAVMASAVALDRRDLFDWSVQQLEVASTQIDAQGYLPNELKRDTRALSYHNYALTPLTMIAAFAKANGVQLSESRREALVRLADRVLGGIEDPAAFREKTGKKQVIADFSERSKFAWLEPYCWTFSCSAALQQRLASMRPLRSYRLGGDLTQIFHPSVAATTPLSLQESSPWTIPLASR